MVKQAYKNNAQHIQTDLVWLAEIIRQRYEFHQKADKPARFKFTDPPELKGNSIYKSFITDFKFEMAERTVLLLSLLPHVAPYFLTDVWMSINGKAEASPFNSPKTDAIPTVDLALFILAGDNLEKRLHYQQLFDEDALIMRSHMIMLDHESGNPLLQQPLKLSPEYLHLLTTGKTYKPGYSMSFPAKRIVTHLGWSDLVLNKNTLEQVNEIKSWIQHGKTLLNEWELGKRLAPGYKVLFFGPPGTGKTLTAGLLGKDAGVDVYRIDLSMVVSKFIGETEKNLSRIFDTANDKEWILFFDEADALFGKRTELRDAHDRYANQEVAFLLQKIEDHNGVVILSSNMRGNIDEAFTRRFQNTIYFPIPSIDERLGIWQNGFSKKSILHKQVSLEEIAKRYEMSGGAIMNAIRYASLKALEANKNIVQLNDLINGISREYAKEGRTI
jgi:hypothetical protein